VAQDLLVEELSVMLPKLLYLHPQSSTFIRKDIDLLSRHYDVKEHGFLMKNKALLPLMFVRQLWFLAFRVPSASRVVVMFGGYHSFLPALLARLMGKKCFIILGGTDCVSYPSIGYGTFRKPFQALLTGWSYRLCSMLLPVHRHLMEHSNTYYEVDGKAQGCKAFVPDLKTPFVEIFNGFDAAKWDVGEKVPDSFITVGYFDTKARLTLKGADLVVEMAKAFPQCQFTIVGVGTAGLIETLPNLRLLGKVTHDELRGLFAQHRYYMQLSISEGFPNAICEAMLSGCIPIGSAVTSIPEIIGDTGLVLHKRDAAQLRDLMDRALQIADKSALGLRARQRISDLFTIDAREKAMLQALH
jgi:glycosyltransferase involved in cell wall biosynthesis